MESHPSKLVGSRGSGNRYFDFDKLAEVQFLLTISDVICVYVALITLLLYKWTCDCY